MVRLGLRSALVLGVAAATIGVGTLGDGTLPTAQASELPAFGDCDELTDFYRTAARPFLTPYGLGGASGYDTFAPPTAVSAQARSGAEAASLDAVGNSPTGTNVQEAGVDEPDSAKTDGEHVITVYGGQLRVVDVTGDTPVLVGRLRIPKTDSGELLLVGDRAVVFGTAWDSRPIVLDRAVSSHPAYGAGGDVVISIVDLSDPGTPRLVGSQRIEGSYVSARAYGEAVRVVVSSTPRLRFDEPGNSWPGGMRKAYKENLRRLDALDADDWLPKRELRDASGRVVGSGPLLSCTDVRHPRRPAGLGTLSVLTFDPAGDTAEEVDRTAVVADGDVVYSSLGRLYVATTAGGWLPWPVLEFERLETAESTSRLAPPRPPSESTTLHAFNVTAGDATTYMGSGAVPGRLLGRWALSEYDGHLRVATTTSGRWPAGPRTAPVPFGPSESHVVVLAERGDRLVQIGRVGGLGRGEQIRAVRWFGDLATVVTFRQTDPLYTVDLSAPEQPRVVGELKIPGYSAYLHPLGGDLLLGIGQDANRFGAERGVQVSAFDLSDLARPTRVDALEVGAVYTQVQEDSRAFTYLPDRRLAVLPVEGYRVDASAEVVSPVVQAVGVSVDADGELRVVGKVEVDGGAYGLRVLPVGDQLVAVTSRGLSVVDPADMEVSAQLRF